MSLVGIVEAAEVLPDVTAVLKRFHVAALERHIVVDVVCCRGQTWVKLVARNTKALTTGLNGKLLVLASSVESFICYFSTSVKIQNYHLLIYYISGVFCQMTWLLRMVLISIGLVNGFFSN